MTDKQRNQVDDNGKESDVVDAMIKRLGESDCDDSLRVVMEELIGLYRGFNVFANVAFQRITECERQNQGAAFALMTLVNFMAEGRLIRLDDLQQYERKLVDQANQANAEVKSDIAVVR